MDSVDCAKRKIRAVISGSQVPEDPLHADNTLEWLLFLNPDAGDALQLAALSHDIERAIEKNKIKRADFNDYDAFKAAHARSSAKLLRSVLAECQVAKAVVDEACRLVSVHEVGGDPDADLLKDADSISYFDVNLPLYYQREGWAETMKRSLWGYNRLSVRAKKIVAGIGYEHDAINRLLREVIHISNTTEYG